MKKIYTLFLLLNIVLHLSAQNVMMIQNGTLLSATGGTVITLQDMNLTINGSVKLQPGDGKFLFNGVAGTRISGISNPLFDVLEIAKTGGAALTLNQSINIGTEIDFTSGLITMGGGNVFLQPNALLKGENENSHLTGTSGNYVQITTMINAPTAVNPGNMGAIITSTQNMGSTVIRRGHSPQTTGAGPGIARYYNILPANDNALNATLRMSYLNAELNSVPASSMSFWKSTDSINWTSEGSSSRDIVNKYVEISGLEDLSFWTLAAGTPLPVQFSSFTVHCNQDEVLIQWQTAQEENSNHFDVQFSTDGISWQTIGTVAAAGNSAQELNYSFTDFHSSGVRYYRVAEYDLNGHANYTDIMTSDCILVTGALTLWPNPVQGQLTVTLTVANSDQVMVKVFDNKGATLREQNNAVLPGINQFYIDMSGFASGIYFIELQWGNNRRTGRIMKTQ